MDPTELMEMINAQVAKLPSLSAAIGQPITTTSLLAKLNEAQAAVQEIQTDAQRLQREATEAKERRRQAEMAARNKRGDAAGAVVAPVETPPDPATLDAAAARALCDQVRKGRLVRIPQKTAAEIAALYAPSAAASGLLAADFTPRHFLFELLRAQLYLDAIDFLAHALPKREAVWWGALCWQLAEEGSVSEARRQAAHAAVKWVLDPSDRNCADCLPAAEAAGLNTPAGLIAVGAFWSGPTMTPAPLPVVPPKPTMTNQTVAAAIKQAALPGGPEVVRKRQRQFLVLGIRVAKSYIPWQ